MMLSVLVYVALETSAVSSLSNDSSSSLLSSELSLSMSLSLVSMTLRRGPGTDIASKCRCSARSILRERALLRRRPDLRHCIRTETIQQQYQHLTHHTAPQLQSIMFCSWAVLDPRAGQTTDVLTPLIHTGFVANSKYKIQAPFKDFQGPKLHFSSTKIINKKPRCGVMDIQNLDCNMTLKQAKWNQILFPSTGDMHTRARFKIVNKCKISKFARLKFKDFSRIFKYFQAPYLFSSTFKGLEVFIPNSRISQARYEPCTQHMHCTRVWLSQCSGSFKPRRKIMKFIAQLYF